MISQGQILAVANELGDDIQLFLPNERQIIQVKSSEHRFTLTALKKTLLRFVEIAKLPSNHEFKLKFMIVAPSEPPAEFELLRERNQKCQVQLNSDLKTSADPEENLINSLRKLLGNTGPESDPIFRNLAWHKFPSKDHIREFNISKLQKTMDKVETRVTFDEAKFVYGEIFGLVEEKGKAPGREGEEASIVLKKDLSRVVRAAQKQFEVLQGNYKAKAKVLLKKSFIAVFALCLPSFGLIVTLPKFTDVVAIALIYLLIAISIQLARIYFLFKSQWSKGKQRKQSIINPTNGLALIPSITLLFPVFKPITPLTWLSLACAGQISTTLIAILAETRFWHNDS